MEAPAPKPDAVAQGSASGGQTFLFVLGSLLVVVLLGLLVFFVTRESEEEKALQAVCASRADIKQRVESLASTTVTNFSLDGFKENVQGISNDVSTIRSNQAKLDPNRRQELKAANQTFETAVASSLRGLGSSLSSSNAQEKLNTAGQQLVTAYNETLETVDCSGVDIDG